MLCLETKQKTELLLRHVYTDSGLLHNHHHLPELSWMGRISTQRGALELTAAGLLQDLFFTVPGGTPAIAHLSTSFLHSAMRTSIKAEQCFYCTLLTQALLS